MLGEVSVNWKHSARGRGLLVELGRAAGDRRDSGTGEDERAGEPSADSRARSRDDGVLAREVEQVP